MIVTAIMTDLRVLIIADNLLARAGLAALLSAQPGCVIAGQTSSSETLPDDIELYRPDVIVYDLGWSNGSVPESLARIRDIPVVALLADDSQAADVAAAFRSEEAAIDEPFNRAMSLVPAPVLAAYGLMQREAEPERLVAALTAVANGLLVIDPALAAALLPAREDGTAASLAEDLTPREFEVLQLLAEGLPNKIIANQLNISEHTVKFHVNALMTKLDAQSRTEAVVRATRLGLIIL